jgi:hypothetical protein
MTRASKTVTKPEPKPVVVKTVVEELEDLIELARKTTPDDADKKRQQEKGNQALETARAFFKRSYA